MGRCLGALLVVAACYAPSPQAGAPCSTRGTCPEPLVCAADNTCRPPGDEPPLDAGPDATASCGPDEAPCMADCSEQCLRPAHVATGFGTFASASLAAISLDDATLDTTTGAITGVRAANTSAATYEVNAGIGFVRRAQADGAPAIAIWVFGELATAGRITATGTAAVVLASANRLHVGPASVIDLGANGLVPGAGGFAGGPFRTAGGGCGGGGAPAGTGTSGDTGGTDGGGGGGSFGTRGGAGGSGTGTAGAAGSIASCADLLGTVLVGGSGGGGGDNSGTVPGPFGGGGGGALQLTAMGQLAVSGTLTVGGGAGRTPEGNSRDGAGGGSGGAVFLEAPVIVVESTAGIFANGGGGGSGSAGTGSACGGPLAENGKPSLATASGSRCAPGFGGNGAAGTTAATPGASAIAGGGGGGGLGRIVLRTQPGRTPMIATADLSPGPSSAAFAIVDTLD